MNALIEIKDLEVRFVTPEGTVHAVNGVSFYVEEGETLAVVGESGSGKSVTMMSMLGLIPIPPGEIVRGSAVYRGNELLTVSEDELNHVRGREIGIIFQDPMTSLNPVLTIGKQITESLKTHMAMDDKQASDRATTLLEWVGIPDAGARLGDYPHQFSGGMRQRVMIAIALACAPSLLIADEPTTALDVTIQAQIVELVIRMREQLGMAVIWITHDLGVVAGIADRVAVMYAGQIVETADVDTLYENPRHPYTLALLAALPRVDSRRERLKAIPGAPPNMLSAITGCPFAPRCDFALEKGWEETPELETVSEPVLAGAAGSTKRTVSYKSAEHRIACWVNVHTGDLR